MKISKTNFIIFLDCAKNAWLKIHKPNIYKKYPLSSFELNIIETGNEIDKLARELFPGGKTVVSREDTALTKKLLKNKTPVIYQPVFSTEKFIMASDIFAWNDKKKAYDLYEVKSSTASEENGGRKTDDYLTDLAFQKIVLDELGIKVGSLNLIRLNKNYVRIGDLDIKNLFLIENLTEQVKEKIPEIKEKMEAAYQILNDKREPEGPCDCILRGWNSHCTTSRYSMPDLPEYPVHAIARISRKKLIELVDNNILNIHDVPEDFELSENQRRQVNTAQSGREYINKKGIADFLKTIKYPVSFLDYETYPAAIPRFNGYRPYQQIPFQFSLHITEEEGKETKHFDFIYTEKNRPDEYFSKTLKEYMPKTGSVIVWNERFEKGKNEQLAEHLPEYKEFLKDINNRVVDLMTPFYGKTTLYDHPKFMGSASIKYVGPVLAPNLSYKNLHIQEGGAASDTWNKIVSDKYSEKEKEEKIKALKDYCHLDTLLMVEIWKKLK